MVYYKVKEKKKKYKGEKREGVAHRVFNWEQQQPSFTVLAGGALKPGAVWMCLRDPPLDTPKSSGKLLRVTRQLDPGWGGAHRDGQG